MALESQAPYLRDIDPTKSEELAQKKARVEDRYVCYNVLNKILRNSSACRSAEWVTRPHKVMTTVS